MATGRYTPYTLKGGKVVNVPNDEVTKLQTQLKLSRSEAVELWLYDEGYIENSEADELTAKAKENKVSHNARAEVIHMDKHEFQFHKYLEF